MWSPFKIGQIQKLDALQWSFLRKIHTADKRNYWETLQSLKLYSTQRRRERYRILYIWKIIEKILPNVNNSVQCYQHIRHGRKCNVKYVRGVAAIKNLKEASLPIRGACLFNVLPKSIRDIKGVSVDVFKNKLDSFLRQVPDEPQITGYTVNRRADSNSIMDMIKIRDNTYKGLALEC